MEHNPFWHKAGLACPLCGQEVHEANDNPGEYCCVNEYCPSYSETDTTMYDTLIKTSKALDVAREMYQNILEKYIRNLYESAPQYAPQHCLEGMKKYDKAISEIMKGGK